LDTMAAGLESSRLSPLFALPFVLRRMSDNRYVLSDCAVYSPFCYQTGSHKQ